MSDRSIVRRILATCPVCGQEIHADIDLNDIRKDPSGIAAIPLIHGENPPHVVILYIDHNGALRGIESYDKIITVSVSRQITERISMTMTSKNTDKKNAHRVKPVIRPILVNYKFLKKIKNPIERKVLALCDGKKSLEEISLSIGIPMDQLLIIIAKYVAKKYVFYQTVYK